MEFEFIPTRKVFIEKTKKFKNQELWNRFIEKNQDAYGKCCVDVARRVMEILDENDMPLEKSPNQYTSFNIITKAEEDVNSGGITGFMASAIVFMVRSCHMKGEEFYLNYSDK